MPLYAPSLSDIAPPILTIGHSTHESGAFLGLLRRHGVRLLADVRRFPGSRRHPQFGAERLAGELRAAGIGYEHFAELGGRRRPLNGSANAAWQVGQFRGYADHMASREFETGLRRLLERAAERRTAVMCAEADWRRCHRRLLSDALVARGLEVVHIGPRGELARHELTPFALVEGERITYPPPQPALEG